MDIEKLTERARGFLQEMIEHYPGVAPVLALAQLVQRDEGIDKAQAFKMHCIRNRTTVREELRRLVDQVVSSHPTER